MLNRFREKLNIIFQRENENYILIKNNFWYSKEKN